MSVMVNKDKWILYKHTNSYALIKAVAFDVKNNCKSNITDVEKREMQDRLHNLNLYTSRKPDFSSLDAINHRINTLKFFMFGYEDKTTDGKKFIYSPLGNLFLKYIDNEEKLPYIFLTMLWGIQFEHPASSTPSKFKLFPFRLVYVLMLDSRLNFRLYNTEFIYFLPFVEKIDRNSYEKLVEDILVFRKLKEKEVIEKLKSNEHVYVNCTYEWQYYVQKILSKANVLNIIEGNKITRLYHPSKKNSKSSPTGRFVTNGYVEIPQLLKTFVTKLLGIYSLSQKPLELNNSKRLSVDIIKEIYNFFPKILLDVIGESISLGYEMLELPKLIENYSRNIEGDTAYKFEDVLFKGFSIFYNVKAHKIGGPSNPDIECLYLTKNKKFSVEAKSTSNKLLSINFGRLKQHMDKIGAEYTIVITPDYVPAATRDISGTKTVIILANTFSEYLYYHISNDFRGMDYEEFDRVISQNFGTDISKKISDITINKFAAKID